MKKKTIVKFVKAFVASVSLLAVVFTPVVAEPTVITAWAASDQLPVKVTFEQTEARSILGMINEMRTGSDAWYWDVSNTQKVSARGLQPLSYDKGLEQAAMQRAAEISVSFSHVRPNGEMCFSVIPDWTSSPSAVGENIAMGYDSAESVNKGWREDNEKYSGQGHRRNMLSDNFSYVGIGHVIVDGVDYWVEEFSSSREKVSYSLHDGDQTVNVPLGDSEADSNTIEDPEIESDQPSYEDPETETLQPSGETTSEKKTVIVSGLKKKISKAVSSDAIIKDAIVVSPVHACKVKLQYYDSGNKKWKTAKTYTMKNSDSGKITLQYTSQWKKERKTTWRVYIPASDGYEKYISHTVTITSSRPENAKIALSLKAAVIIRASDGYVIYGKKKDKKLPVAGTTEMMTALLMMENGNLKDVTSISAKAASTGQGCLGASAGMKFRVKDLLNVMLIHSSSDAASALAEYEAGSIKKFASKMNKRAKQLGCKNTHFVNPHGLNNTKHYSTAYDLALIQRECIKHKTYNNIVKKSSYSFSTVGKPKHKYSFDSTDELLGTRKGFLGGSTGYNKQAGNCFCGIYKYKGVTYIFTVLGNSSSSGRWDDCRKLMNFIKENYK